ncbi:MAG: hypothetical protein ACRBM6_29270 [Geminicoccales bacterium]
MKRRQLLRMAAMAALGGGVGQSMISAPTEASPATAKIADNLLRVYADRNSASIVGTAFLQSLSERPNMDQLVRGLVSNLDLSTEKALAFSPSELRQHLKGITSTEFDRGQTAKVQGWVLAKTEAWLCALATLRLG